MSFLKWPFSGKPRLIRRGMSLWRPRRNQNCSDTLVCHDGIMTIHHSLLFLSGAGLPTWIWDDVRRELESELGASTVTTVAPRPSRNTASLRDYAESAIEAVETNRLTIVAHSAGGVVAAGITSLVPDHVDGLLALSAVVPKPGGSFISAMPAPNRWILNVAMRLAGTRPPDSAIRKTLAHGLDESVVERLIADFETEPLSFYRDPVGQRAWDGPKGYVTTSCDRELPRDLQRTFGERLGASWHDEIETGHLPMLENPRGVVDSVVRFLDTSRNQ